jgi:predicted phosphodiesterase
MAGRAPGAGPNSKTASKQADGVDEKAEDRAAHIAEKIRECAGEMGVPVCDLTWHDFRAYGDVAWGSNSLGIVRRDITRLGGFNAIRDSYFKPTPTDHAVTRGRLREHAAVNRRLGADERSDAFLFGEIERFAQRVFRGRVRAHKTPRGARYCPPKTAPATRIITAVLSDLHYGSDLKANETGYLSFGRVEEARRTSQLVKQILAYKKEYREEQDLELLLLGDIIQGTLHDPRDGAVMSEQISRAIHLLSQAIAVLAQSFRFVRVRCVTGNHGRNSARHRERATFQKFDSHETTIYSCLKAMLWQFANVSFSIPLTPFHTYDVFGRKVFVTHGDTVLKPGNPGKSINVGSLESQINRINASLRDKDEYAVVIVGHVHVASVTYLANGTALITNGPLLPSDNFAVSLGHLENVCGQWIFESVAGHPVGDMRLITLDKSHDTDASLDTIVKPWSAY